MRHAHYAMTGVAVMALLLLSGGQARADDDPEIAVEMDANEVFIGEGVDYLVEIRNAKNPSAPDLSALRGFRRRGHGQRVAQPIVHLHHQRPGHPAEQLRPRLPVPPDAEAHGQASDPGPVRDDRRQDGLGPDADA